MILYHRHLSVRLLAAAAVIGLVSIGCQTADTQTGSGVAIGPIGPPPVPIFNGGHDDGYYSPPPMHQPREISPVPPAPVPPAIDDLTWSYEGENQGHLKPVSSLQDSAPRFLSPGRVKSIKDFITGSSPSTVR